MIIIDDRLIHQIAGAIRSGILTEGQLGVLDDAANRWAETLRRPRRGVITRWRAGETYGFINEDGTGAVWFVSREEKPKPPVGLAERDVVEFSGNPLPEPKRRYPTAGNVRRAGMES